MTDDGVSTRPLEKSVLLCGVVAVLGCGFFIGLEAVPGALCGAALAYVNILLIRVVLQRAYRESGLGKAFLVRYMLKFFGLVAVVGLVIRSGRFDTAGFLFGLSALVGGIFLGGLSSQRTLGNKISGGGKTP